MVYWPCVPGPRPKAQMTSTRVARETRDLGKQSSTCRATPFVAEDERSLRRQIARASVGRLADGLPETTLLGIPFEEMDSIRDVVRDTADRRGVEVEMEDRIGDGGLVHLDIWLAGIERSGVVGDMSPPGP